MSWHAVFQDWICVRRRNGAVRRFARQAHRSIDVKMLQRLRVGWGNQDYSADIDFLCAVADMAVSTPGAVLECGTGVTTVILGLMAGQRGAHVCALEHDKAWHTIMAKTLSQHRIDGVRLHLAPLRDYGSFTWYDPPLQDMPDQFSLVVCDGPPEVTPGGRYGLLSVLGDRLVDCTILFDDANTGIGKKVLARWTQKWGTVVQVVSGSTGDFAIVKTRPAGV